MDHDARAQALLRTGYWPAGEWTAEEHDARTGRLYPPPTAAWHLRHRSAEEAEQRRLVRLLRRPLRDRR